MFFFFSPKCSETAIGNLLEKNYVCIQGDRLSLRIRSTLFSSGG